MSQVFNCKNHDVFGGIINTLLQGQHFRNTDLHKIERASFPPSTILQIIHNQKVKAAVRSWIAAPVLCACITVFTKNGLNLGDTAFEFSIYVMNYGEISMHGLL